MKTIIYKMNSNRILGFLMAFAIVFFSYNAQAQCNVQVTATVVDATSATASDGSIIATLNNGTAGNPTCQATVTFSNGVTNSGYGGMSFTNPNLSPGTYTVISTDCQGCTDTVTVSVGVTVPQNCVASGAMCPCPMIYMPVCGCDGVLYSNDCIANCQGVSYTPAIPDGNGGFLPCTVASTPGCTDPLASNYDPSATVDDGSCVYPISGCTDSTATNYNPLATIDDSSCLYGSCTMTASITSNDESCAGACDGVVSANVSSSACISLDTIIPGTHLSNYNSTMVRGYYFQAQSSFVISYLRASDGNPQVTNSQSVAIVDYGATPPVAYPATTGSHTTLFSAVDAGTGWIACNVNIVAGNYYAVLGAKHDSGNSTMYNSYGTGGTVLNLDGIPTTVNRAVLQTVIPVGGPASGTVMSNATGSIGRVDLITGITSPGALSYLWSTGDTTQSVGSLCVGTYSVTITDCQGCVSSASATIGTAIVSGCTDSTASNFNPCAVIDDGSCLVACPSGIGANSESFEDPAVPLNAQGPWANWTYDVASSTFTLTNGWRKDNLGTSSTNTGPANGAASFDGNYYLYCETSGGGINAVANLHSACIDLNNFANPSFAFAYHMYGATMGTLNIDVSNDGGATWNNMWTESGDQGNQWYETGISLSSYAGQIIQVRMSYTSGTSFTGDCAIDYLRFIDGLNIGCMDSTACNYDSTATIGAVCDYTCLGCTDPLATNYDSTATVDDGSCAYPCTPYVSGVSILVDADASCNGGSDGQASAVVASSNGNDYYLWSTGATTSTVTGLSAGTYTCTVTDSVYGCVATVSVVISEPLAVTVTGTTIDAMPGQNNGQASITVSGGTPCVVSASLISHNPLHSSNGQSGIHFNIINTSSSPLTITDLSQGSYASYPSNTLNVYYKPGGMGNPLTATGWTQCASNVPVTIPVGTFAAPAYSAPYAINPVVIPAGATYGFYIQGTSSFSYATATASGAVGSVVASDANISITSGYGGTPLGSGTFSPRAPVIEVFYGDPGVTPYTYSWTNGDSTQNVTGLPLGPIGVTVTDCNGCTGNWMGFILTNTLPGCTDPTAFNYNPLANLDDSSCIPVILGCIDSLNLISGMPNVNYSSAANTDDGSCTDTLLGCTDSLAANYNMYANVDDGSCIVACPTGIGANQDGFETATGTTQQGPWTHWTLDATTNTFTLTNAWRSWTGSTGSSSTGPTAAVEGTYYLYCETSGQSNKTASLVSECVDLSNFTSPTFVASYHMYGATMGILNIDISNDGGWTWTNLWTESGDQGNQWYDAVIDLNTYASQIVQVRMNYTSGTSFTGDCAIDNLRFMEAPMSGCMDPLACNYDSNATISDGSCYVLTATVTTSDISCNGLTDGTATVSANAPLASYLWSNGATTATTTGLAVGTYSCIVTDSLGCVDSTSVSISEPNPITLSMTIGNESSAGAGDGQIDLSVSGGVPCATNVQVGSGAVSSFQSYLWYTFYMDGHTEITYPASELATLGMNSGDIMDELGWKILTLGSGYTMNNAQMTVNGVVVYTGNYTPVAGMNNFVFSTPVTYTGGDVVVTWCFDNAAYVSGNNMFESTMTSGTISNYSDLATSSGCTAIVPTLARSYRPNAYIGFASASGYTYNWSNGDTTEDVTNLTSGSYCVTVTDCNGCTASLCDSVGISATLGCTDPTAMNYNSFANQDDGSCLYDCTVFGITLDSMGNVTGCNGGSNGYVAASINMSGSVIWLDNGSTVANRSNMSAGTYSLVAVTPDGICYDTLNVTITEPSAISLSMAIGNESALGATDGQIDLTVTGGTACYTGSPILITEYDPGAPDALEIQNVSGSDLDVTGWTVHVSGSYTDINNTNPTVQTLSGIMSAGATQYWTDGSVNPWGSNLFWNPGVITSFRGWIMIKDASGTVMDVFIANWNATEIAASTVGLAGMWVGDGWNQTTVLAGNSASRIAPGNDATVFTNVVSTLGVTNSGLILPFSSAGAYSYVWSSGDSTEDVTNLTAGVYCVTVTDCNGCTASLCDTIIVAATPGCTDPLASNYNSFATIDDGSCLYPGCTDTTALNYDPNANIDDGSCILPCSVIAPVCEDFSSGVVPLGACPQVGGWSTSVVSGDGWRFTGNPGYNASTTMGNNRPQGTFAWIDFSATDVGVVMQMDPVDVSALSNPALTFDYFSDIGTYVLPVANIMHIEAYNGVSWDSVATFQEFTTGWVSKSVDVSTYAVAGVVTLRFRGESSGQGSDFYNDLLVDDVCIDEGQIVVVSGCTDSTATNYNSLATVDDGSCVYPAVPGCTDSTAFNYNPLATIDDSSCLPVQLGCLDSTAVNYNSNANTDDGSCVYAGCTDPLSPNYNPLATIDDGSCIAPPSCTEDSPTNLSATDVIQSRATINWDNMNSSVCLVDQYRIKFRAVGSSSWTQKTMGQPVGSCLWAANNTSKLILNLLPNTQYEYQMKAWYCGGSASAWTALHYFTTMPDCPNVGNLAVTTPLTTRATFTWDDSNGTYSFVRIKSKADTLNSTWFNIGGLGVAHGIFTKDKNNLSPGETYRAQARTWCSPNGGAYKSPTWTPLVFWTQPTIRLEVGTAISNLDVYPNPSRDIFNVTFTSEDVQDLEVRIINVVGEVVYTENLQQYVGEYTKQIDLAKYTKGIYFLEITTDNGVVNKKLILQ